MCALCQRISNEKKNLEQAAKQQHKKVFFTPPSCSFCFHTKAMISLVGGKALILMLLLIFSINSAYIYAASKQDHDATKKTISINEFAALVATRSPEALIKKTTLDITQQVESRSGLLPDPMFSVSRDDVPVPNSLRDESAMMEPSAKVSSPKWKLAVTQPFPWPGTLRAQRNMAIASTNVAKTSVEAAMADRFFSALEFYVEMIRTQYLIKTQKDILGEANAFRDFVHERFRQGIAGHLEYLQTYNESSLITTNISTLEVTLENLEQHALVFIEDAPGIDPLNISFDLFWPNFENEKGVPYQLQEKSLKIYGEDGEIIEAVDYNKSILLLNQQKDVANKEVLSKQSLPGISLTAMAMVSDDGMRGMGAMLSMALPIYSHSERQALKNEIALLNSKTSLDLSWYEKRKNLALHQAQRRISTIRKHLNSLESDILPKVREHLEAATIIYGQGKGSVQSIIDSRRELISLDIAKINLISALINAQIGVARIERGFIDTAIDLPVPNISYTSMPGSGGGSMDSGEMSNMKSANGMKEGAALKNSGARGEAAGPADPGMDSKAMNSSSMGM